MYGPAEGASAHRRTTLIDRDGVINVNRVDHVKSWEEFEFLPGALEAVSLLRRSGYRVLVVTNQANLGRGVLSPSDLAAIHHRMVEVIGAHGGSVEAILVCPHRPDQGCPCRKPAPGLILEAHRTLGVRLDNAVVIGDHPWDLEAAERAGCRSALVLSGRTRRAPTTGLPGGYISAFPDLLRASRHLVRDWPCTPGPEAPSPKRHAPLMPNTRREVARGRSPTPEPPRSRG